MQLAGTDKLAGFSLSAQAAEGKPTAALLWYSKSFGLCNHRDHIQRARQIAILPDDRQTCFDR
jgi:hypothetical protein